MGYALTCKLCGCPINILDMVESKAGGLRIDDGETRTRKRTPKFYHAECYDDFHLDFDKEGKPLNGRGNPIKEIDDLDEKDLEDK